MGPSRGAVPAVAPVERVLVRTDAVVISLSRFWVYSAGLEFQVFVDADDDWMDLQPFDDGRRRRASGTRADSSERLLFGFQFADGSKATTLDDGPDWSGETSGSPMLLCRSGSSGGGHWRQDYWLGPLPPPGQLSFVCQWPAAGIPITRVDLDAEGIADACSRSQTIFPESREASR
jgi:hypothetical protein